jgi:hypothetical protein
MARMKALRSGGPNGNFIGSVDLKGAPSTDCAALMDQVAPQQGRAAPAEAPVTVSARIELPELDICYLRVAIVGVNELICHQWSDKARKLMLNKQMNKASLGKQAKNPVEDYQATLYRIQDAPAGAPFEDGVFGFPAIAFKDAAVTACTSLGKSITKIAARQAFHTEGPELVRVYGRPYMREDMVRLNGTTADVRHRASFKQWGAFVDLSYNKHVLSHEQIINLMNTAGYAVGVGEWRPETNGNFGRFRVSRGDEPILALMNADPPA